MEKSKNSPIDWLGCKQATLIGTCLAAIMLTTDVTSVGVALDSIGQELNANFAQLQWVMNAFNLSFGTFLLSAGSLADLWGRRRFFIIGVALFIVAALMCGLSQDSLTLNLARAIEGICAALVLPTGPVLISSAFPDKSARAKAFGLFGSSFGFGLAIGPILGGALTTTLSWRWIFLINVPIGLTILILAVPKMCESQNPEATKIDWVGLLVFSLSMILFMYALISGPEIGWNSPKFISIFIGAVVAIALFVTVERGQRYPMFDLKLFHKPTFVAAQILPVALSSCVVPSLIYLPLYFQGVNEYSPLQAGLAILPLTIPMSVVPVLVSPLVERFSMRRMMSIALVLNSLGAFWLSKVFVQTEATPMLLGALLVLGIAAGMVNGQGENLALNVVPPEYSGKVSGIYNTIHITGDATIIGLTGAILIGFTQSRLSDLLWGTSVELGVSTSQIADQIVSGNISNAVKAVRGTQEIFTEAAIISYSGAFSNLLLITACVSFIGAVLMLTLIRSKDMYSSNTSSVQPPQKST